MNRVSPLPLHSEIQPTLDGSTPSQSLVSVQSVYPDTLVDKTVTVELVECDHPRYGQVLETASTIYQEVLGFEMLSPPPRFVALLCGNEVLGSGGIYYGSDKSELVVEQFSRSNWPNVLKYLRGHSIDPCNPEHRRRFAEVTCFNVVQEYRRTLVKPLLGYIFLYLYRCRVPATLNIQAGTLARSLRQIGSQPFTFCDANLTHFDGSCKQKQLIQRRYIDRLRPRCVGINSRDIATYFKQSHLPKYQHLLPGQHLQQILLQA